MTAVTTVVTTIEGCRGGNDYDGVLIFSRV